MDQPINYRACNPQLEHNIFKTDIDSNIALKLDNYH